MKIYRTKFTLTNSVLDFDAARQYLTEDDMTVYLRDYLSTEQIELVDKIIHVEWVLENEYSGYIELTTSETLTVTQLKVISEWVSGQNSDGLGEGFEQQPFAEEIGEGDWIDDGYYDEDGEWVEDGYYEECYTMASFDWKTNKYQFEEVMV